ncbi:MAG: hypothetical protein EPO28_15200 [Saprospiraceae bacterium]|nr:MAG: hypothetical protein EPO28_15200 [Saprospiraceae bacterium]
METLNQTSSYKGTITEIHTLDDVRAWFEELNENFGLSWHPDDPFDWGSYTPADVAMAAHLDALMDKAFEICDAEGVEIYKVGLEVNKPLRRAMGLGTDYMDD